MKLRYYWVTTLMLMVYLAILDHIVNATLYEFGLIFSWEWFSAYGLCMFMIWVFAGLRSGFLYYFNSAEPDKLKTSIALVVTDIAIWAGGFLDFIWFLIDGKLPAPDRVWWWMPQAQLIPNYNIIHHAVYVSIWTAALAVLWWKIQK